MRIEKLEPSQRVRDRWLVWLEGGELLRVTEGEVTSFALYAGKELSGETLAALTESAGKSRVRAKALDLVAAKPMSRRELTQKLTAKPFRKPSSVARDDPGAPSPAPIATAEQAQGVCDWLEELGYLNDAEYARTVARHYSAKGYGDRRVRDELFRRGVPRQYWDEALEAAEPPQDGIDDFLRKRFKGEVPDQKELKRASDALARRGYRWDEIKEGLRRYGAEIEEE